MGVPVVTLASGFHAGRVGVSLLTSAGLPYLIAQIAMMIKGIAATLAGDLNQLSRNPLHPATAALLTSPLMHGPRLPRKTSKPL